MNKTDLVDEVAMSANLPKVSANKVIDTVFDAIISALTKGDQVVLMGFGTFTVKSRSARKGRNPKTGEVIDIQASKMATFKPGKVLKDQLKEESVNK